MVMRRLPLPSTYDEVIDDPETGLVAGVFYPKTSADRKPSLWARIWTMTRSVLRPKKHPEPQQTMRPACEAGPLCPEGPVQRGPAEKDL
jgi:hypothetical protein